MDFITVESILRVLRRGSPFIGILIFLIALYIGRRVVARIMKPVSRRKMNRVFVSWWDKSRIKGAYIMENRRKIIISISLVVIILMGLFPPWVEKLKTKDLQLERPLGYGFILSPPEPSNSNFSISIDFSRLFLQWVILILITGLCIYLYSRKDKKWEEEKNTQQKDTGTTEVGDLITCPQCKTKNWVSIHASNVTPKCANCKTNLQ